MKFSTKSTYGLRAIIRLAKNSSKGNMSLATIANEENISLSYLERLFSKLKKANLVKADKGVSGGYSLARPAEQINSFEIIKALEEQKNIFYCLDEKGKIYCSKSCNCQANHVLAKLQKELINTLKKVSLKELIN